MMHLPDLILRQANWSDREKITTFNQRIAKETENLALNWERLLAGVSSLIEDPSKGFYLLACQKERILGQLAITYEWSDWRNGHFWWIQSVYVDAEFRNKGVYHSMHQHIKTLAKQNSQVCGLRLYVEHENHVAQRVYESNAMQRTKYHMMEESFVSIPATNENDL